MSDYLDYYGTFRQQKFVDTYPPVGEFLADYNRGGIPTTISTESATTLYYLLYAYYGNSVIASSDLNRFRYNLFSIIWQYGPTWEKRVEIQKKLRELTDDEIFTGSKQIANHALNPSTAPSTASLEELTYVDAQNTMSWKRSKLEGYNQLMSLLDNDVSSDFLRQFRKLFLTIVEPEAPLYFVSDDAEEEVAKAVIYDGGNINR